MKLLLLAFGILFVLTGCRATEAPEENLPLQIGLMPTMDSVVIATAYELGLFEAHGVDVEVIPFSSARDRDAAFQAGALDGATVDLIAVGLFNEGGFQSRATSITTAHFTLVARSEYTDLESLADATVMISYHTAIDFIMDQMLAVNDLPNDHLIREEVGNIPTRFEMVRAGQADAALISEPFATMTAAEGLSIITDTFQIDFNPLALAFSLEVIEHRADELRAFYLAYSEAVDFLNENPIEAYLDVIIDLIGFPEEVIHYIELPTFLIPEIPTDEMVQTALDWLIEKDLISADTSIESFIHQVQ